MKLKEIQNYLKTYAPATLRICMALVFLYFGVSQIITPEAFIGWLPKEVSMIPISARHFVLLNGLFELLFGTMLALGLFTRLSSFLLGAHLMGITITIGFTEIGVRDFGLAAATLVLTMIGPSAFSLDELFREKVYTPTETQNQN